MRAIQTDILIIGAGPVGLFTVFEAGLLKMRCHIMDVLPQIGGQLTEIYPKKPIYDIPGYPSILASDLVDNLRKQIDPFKPTFTLGEIAERIEKLADGSFRTAGHDGTVIESIVIAIAGGLGCFEPRKPDLEGIDKYEGKGVDYFIKNPSGYTGKRVVIAGGGDSALDWTIELAALGSHVTLVHRRASFRGALDSVDKVMALVKEGKAKLITDASIVEVLGENNLEAVTIEVPNGRMRYEADYFLPLFGLTPKLGPIADWGLGLDKNAIVVDPLDYSTNVKGIYAIGDINTYPGKLKLILCGFHEATMMCQSAFQYMYPDQKLSFKYTTVTGIDGFNEVAS
ncbi:MAG: NAD(P)/FAD-dependent oxidoreductase [Saprospiraceae bacterium]|nr:NAD(P)/FAD-dependent oxidoreductase [Candidatus Opimibacter iunctus]